MSSIFYLPKGNSPLFLNQFSNDETWKKKRAVDDLCSEVSVLLA